MKKSIQIIFSILCWGTTAFSQAPITNQFVDAEIPQWPVVVNPGEYVPNQLLVMLNRDVEMGDLEKQFSEKGFTIIAEKNSAKSMRIWTLTFADGTNISDALKVAKTFSGIELAQFNHYVAHRASIPNDSQFGLQWSMNNTGQNGGTPDADIDAAEAWDISTGGMTVQGDTIVVAVIDAGFDLAQPDLNFKKNYGEIPNNNVDDDGNGYIDDYDGWNAYNSDGNITSDLHGTHVCGIVGARGNNSLGVAGVNWGVKILPIMGADGTEAQVAEAYSYVFDARKLYNTSNGAQGEFIVSTNSSFGVDMGQPAAYPIWCAMYDSMGTVGVLSAGATANQNWDIDVVGDIPTACSSNYLISVTNTDRNDLRNSSAAFGDTTIDMGAPGTQIESTLPSNQYGILTGTSMATPHVAGAVALMYAAACNQTITDYKNKPDSIALVIKNLLLTSTDPNASLAGITVTGGRLNLFNSLVAVQTLYNCTTLGVSSSGNNFSQLDIFPNPANETVSIDYFSSQESETEIRITNMLGEIVAVKKVKSQIGKNLFTIDISDLSRGIYFVQVNGGGNLSNAQKLLVV